MRREVAENAHYVVTGTFSIKTQPINVLFDFGATHSFIFVKLVETLELFLTLRSPLLSVALLDGKTVRCD